MTPPDAPLWMLLGISGALVRGLAPVRLRTRTEPRDLALLALLLDHPDNAITFRARTIPALVARACRHRRTRPGELLSHARHDFAGLERTAPSLAGGAPLDDAPAPVRGVARARPAPVPGSSGG